MPRETLRIITPFSDGEKRDIVSAFNEEKERTGIGITTYAALIGISRYTLRDWYRDPRYNDKWMEQHPEVRDQRPVTFKNSKDAMKKFMRL